MKRPATKAEREYLAWVKTQPCVINNGECQGQTQVHHVGIKLGLKKDHKKVIPLCFRHHLGEPGIGYHHTGSKTFSARYGSELDLLAQFEALSKEGAK